MMSNIQNLREYYTKQIEEEYERDKDRYENIQHFLDLYKYNLMNNTNFTPEEMSYENLYIHKLRFAMICNPMQ